MVKKDSSDQEASHQQKDGNKGEPCGSEVPFLELFNSTGTAMGLLDDDGLIIRSNDRFSELVDLPGDRIDGKVRWNEFVPDEDQVKVLKFHEMRPGSEDPPGEYDLLFKKYNGEIIHVHMNLSLIPDHNVWIFSIVDNEDSFRMEVELKEREKSLSDEVRKQHKIQGALFELATNPKILDVDLEDNIRTITKMISDLLDVERVSLWVLRNGRGSIECMDQYIRSEEKHSSGMRIRVKDHRHYIKALKDNPVIDINNGMLDDRTIEFAKGYVDVLNIYSMLDTGIWIRGELIGSLSIESVGVNRKWTMEE
ncbi:MAG: PAS domain S-box protein, partial [Candidatus Thermoplasmatota archaeon]|nr:PAS domain S-box protein [Candidatus Thermoplasmatota archaeon]